MGTGDPLISTLTALHVAGTGVTFMQFPKNTGSPRFEPVMAATIPGASGPETIEAALTTPAAVKVGVCACAENAPKENKIVMPNSDLRKVYSISDEVISKLIYISVAPPYGRCKSTTDSR